MSAPRPVDVARLALGTACIARPDLPVRLGEGRDVHGTRLAVRILGARYVVQSGAGLVLSQTRPWVRDVDAAVDLVHTATMLALAAVAPRHRRIALLSAGTAVAFAAADLREKLR